ncbi:hypothetical protein BCF33_2235 [Hasllibacter halocynthiae]|uniref:Uncharacterized protein n=1 Tax=Hasllibacter halocynthiae TaxID=595589 RepID=A0A2T0X378_9RHOB|nr:hypothetical protein [Hasllibacter halocynthiae]PRY93367.1 hypothetical protein BCF33_2235 [Hasllibacter halocynthiae]
MRLTDGRIREGVWSARLESEGEPGPFAVTLRDREVPHEVARIEGTLWEVRVPIPPSLIGEGIQTGIVAEPGGRRLAHFTLVAGEDAGADLRAEVDLLRAELDLLKRAFRRHCAGTARG